MTFEILNQATEKEFSDTCLKEFAKTRNLISNDIDQFAMTEDGHVVLLDDCGNYAYFDQDVIVKTSGDFSDGYHTFDSLYHQRAILFATIVNAFSQYAWKSHRHSDGERPFGKNNYFIVGITTPDGNYTYHYHDEYWDLFKCKVLDRAPEWDGHTDKDVSRLLSLKIADIYMEHYRQGRADEKAIQEGRLMQTFSPD